MDRSRESLIYGIICECDEMKCLFLFELQIYENNPYSSKEKLFLYLNWFIISDFLSKFELWIGKVAGLIFILSNNAKSDQLYRLCKRYLHDSHRCRPCGWKFQFIDHPSGQSDNVFHAFGFFLFCPTWYQGFPEKEIQYDIISFLGFLHFQLSPVLSGEMVGSWVWWDDRCQRHIGLLYAKTIFQWSIVVPIGIVLVACHHIFHPQ